MIQNNKENSPKFFNFKKMLIISILLLLFIFSIFYILKIAKHYPRKIDLKAPADYFGVTFSTKYCSDMELDYKEVYSAILDELKVKKIRIPIYWNEIEQEEGVFDFSKYDYLVDEGEKRGVDFIISLGFRIPRWPECHFPIWYAEKNVEESKELVLRLTREVVEHYKDRNSVEFWQVENEPFLGTFGACPPLDKELLEEEVALVRKLDDRKIIITSSGELKMWNQPAALGDIFGSTLYRVVHNNWFGFVRYPFTPNFYKIKGRLAGLKQEQLMVLELQAEPWVPTGPITNLSKKEIDKSMSIDQFKANFQYAINIEFGRVYAWGVEWWYFQKKYGNPQYWSIATDIFSQ